LQARADNVGKHRKNTNFEKSPDQRIFWLICRFFVDQHCSGLLQRFLRACRRSANSEYFERLNNRDPETERKWRPRNFEIRVMRGDGRGSDAAARPPNDALQRRHGAPRRRAPKTLRCRVPGLDLALTCGSFSAMSLTAARATL